MATIIVKRISGAGLLSHCNKLGSQQAKYSTSEWLTTGRKKLLTTIGLFTAGAGGLVYALEQSIDAEVQAHPVPLPWYHKGPLRSFDHASLRRGYEVYKNVCSSCHSLKYIAYRHLVDVCLTEKEAKAEAADRMYKDGPDSTGAYFERPGKLTDYMISPYENEAAARFANNGSYPPDLSYIVYARHGGEDYIFSLLTGYVDPPAGVVLQEGQSYNPYFPGGAIGMPQLIFDETVDYADGTPASAAQIAKDVAAFLTWASMPEHDERKLIGYKVIPITVLLLGAVWYYNRFLAKSLKTMKIAFTPKRK